MLELPITMKIIPLVIAGMIAISPVCNLTTIQKDNTNVTTDKTNDNSTTINDKTNQQTTKIVTIREGFKGVLVDGNIFEVPFFQKTTVEKTFNEKEKEEGKRESDSNKEQNSNSHSIEDVPSQHTTIMSRVMDSGKFVVNKIWSKVKP